MAAVLLGCGARELPGEAWGTAEYVAAGVPDPGHRWSTVELTKAVEAIATATADHADRLPRYQGARSGAVFARLVAAPVERPTATVDEQLGDHLGRYDTFNRASKWYANGLGPPRREQLELTDALFKESVAINALLDSFLATLPVDDPSLPTRRNGMTTFRKGVVEMLYASVMIADNKLVPDADRIAILHSVARTIGAVWVDLPTERREEVRSYLGKLAGATTGPLHDAAAGAVAAIEHGR